jgi:exonuclease III
MSNKLIDLIAFNETRLDANITDNMINLDSYYVRKDRSRNGGGVCIYLRSFINYKIRDDLVPSELEAVCIEIINPHSNPFLVITVYRPPSASSEFFDHFKKLINKAIDNENKEMYVLGDLNCNMLKTDKDSNAPIKKIKSLYELYQLSQLIDEATRITMTTTSLIDHIVTNTPEKISDSGVIHTGISDHSLVNYLQLGKFLL